MNTMNIRPAFQYRFLDTLKGVGIFYAIMAVLMAGISCLVFYAVSKGGKVSVSFFAFEFAAAITLFVMGITTIREDMRLMLQNGIGRRTIFVTELLVALSVSLLLAIAGELLIAVGQVVITSRSEFFITDLFQIIYANGINYNLTLGARFESIVLAFGLYTFVYLAGMFISLLFYRLNKIWTLIVAIGAPLLLIMGLRIALTPGSFLALALGTMLEFALSSPWALFLCFLLAAVLISFLNLIAIRRAPIK
ncbi:MAG: hypothetical protein ACOX5W_07955 [Bacillota bacterium]|jgi:hypothetical protein